MKHSSSRKVGFHSITNRLWSPAATFQKRRFRPLEGFTAVFPAAYFLAMSFRRGLRLISWEEWTGSVVQRPAGVERIRTEGPHREHRMPGHESRGCQPGVWPSRLHRQREQRSIVHSVRPDIRADVRDWTFRR